MTICGICDWHCTASRANYTYTYTELKYTMLARNHNFIVFSVKSDPVTWPWPLSSCDRQNYSYFS